MAKEIEDIEKKSRKWAKIAISLMTCYFFFVINVLWEDITHNPYWLRKIIESAAFTSSEGRF